MTQYLSTLDDVIDDTLSTLDDVIADRFPLKNTNITHLNFARNLVEKINRDHVTDDLKVLG